MSPWFPVALADDGVLDVLKRKTSESTSSNAVGVIVPMPISPDILTVIALFAPPQLNLNSPVTPAPAPIDKLLLASRRRTLAFAPVELFILNAWLLSKRISPLATCSFFSGEFVPMPILPDESMVKTSPNSGRLILMG